MNTAPNRVSKRLLLVVFLLLVVSALQASAAAEVEKLYYAGEAKLSSPAGKSFGSQAFLLEKIHNPGNATIIERAIVVKPDRTVEEHTMTIKVAGDSSFTISDAAKTVHGTGKLFGPAWRWTYFKANYESTTGAKIEDENYMTDPDVLVARKTITAPNGAVIMHMDITLKAITPATFSILSETLLKKAPATQTERKP